MRFENKREKTITGMTGQDRARLRARETDAFILDVDAPTTSDGTKVRRGAEE